MSQHAYRLQAAYQKDAPSAVASLAKLRRAIGAAPGDDPAAWAETIGVIGDDVGTDDEPSAQERAAHVALTLFAVHQQAQRDKNMHRSGRSLGRAVRQLADIQGGEDDEANRPILRRFQALGTAHSLAEITLHARSIITQLRAEAIPIDYGRLTDDLIALQDPRRAPSVRLAWARAYYRTPIPDASDSPPPPHHAPEGDPS